MMNDILNTEMLAPYLPYGLNCYIQGECVEATEYNDPSTPKRFKVIGSDESFVFVTDISFPSYEQVCFEDCIPILRPLSDVEDYFMELWYKEDHDTVKFLDFDFLIKFDDLYIEQLSTTKIEYIPYGTIKLLLKHHFDLFDLILNKIAIDINTIK